VTRYEPILAVIFSKYRFPENRGLHLMKLVDVEPVTSLVGERKGIKKRD
jgi:hypothetical protein